MRYGLLALSIAMLTSGGFAAQSAMAISHSATAATASAPLAESKSPGDAYGSLPFTVARADAMRFAVR